jgi:cytochrome b6-f complex iron-sulfur subunit
MTEKVTQTTLDSSIDRAEFMRLVGVSVGAIVLQHCLSGCSTSNDPQPDGPKVDFTISLNAAAYSALKNPGGYTYENSQRVIIARTKQNDFLAVSQECTHEQTTVLFDNSNNTFVCPKHQSVFDARGNVVKDPAKTPLRRFNTTFDATANEVRVFS